MISQVVKKAHNFYLTDLPLEGKTFQHTEQAVELQPRRVHFLSVFSHKYLDRHSEVASVGQRIQSILLLLFLYFNE